MSRGMRFASEAMKNNAAIAKTAVTLDDRAANFIGRDLKADKDFAVDLIRMETWVWRFMPHRDEVR